MVQLAALKHDSFLVVLTRYMVLIFWIHIVQFWRLLLFALFYLWHSLVDSIHISLISKMPSCMGISMKRSTWHNLLDSKSFTSSICMQTSQVYIWPKVIVSYLVWAFKFFFYQIDFYASRTDGSLFIYNKAEVTCYILVYVNDMVVTSTALCNQFFFALDRNLSYQKWGHFIFFLESKLFPKILVSFYHKGVIYKKFWWRSYWWNANQSVLLVR